MASNLLGMACLHPTSNDGLAHNSNGVQPTSDGLQATSDGLHPNGGSDGLDKLGFPKDLGDKSSVHELSCAYLEANLA